MKPAELLISTLTYLESIRLDIGDNLTAVLDLRLIGEALPRLGGPLDLGLQGHLMGIGLHLANFGSVCKFLKIMIRLGENKRRNTYDIGAFLLEFEDVLLVVIPVLFHQLLVESKEVSVKLVAELCHGAINKIF